MKETNSLFNLCLRKYVYLEHMRERVPKKRINLKN